MKEKILNKLVAMLVIFVLTISEFGLFIQSVYAEYEALETQKTQTNNKNVAFDSYFKNDGQKTHSKTINKNESGSLFVSLELNGGYIKSGTATLENPNFKVDSTKINGASYVESNQINLGQIDSNKEVEIPFFFEKQDPIRLDYFDRDTKVLLNGIYVDANGKEREIKGEILVHLTWDETIQGRLEQQVEKVIPLDSQRTLVELSVKTNIVNNSMPSEKMVLHVQTPQIENIKIEEVRAYAVQTTASNGISDSSGFTQNNWEYRAEENQLNITVENIKNENNAISWKDGEDEYRIIYILGSSNGMIGRTMKLVANGEITVGNKVATLEEEKEVVLEAKGSLVNSNLSATASVNKGNLYANSEYETLYHTRWETQLSYKDAIDYVQIASDYDRYQLKDGNIISDNNSTYYKNTTIKKANFDTLFGAEGRIDIYTNGNKTHEINKDTPVDANGNIVISYEGEVNTLEMITTKPVAEGKLVIENQKAIKTQTGLDREIIKNLANIQTAIVVKTNMTSDNYTANIGLNETTTKAEISMGTNSISSVIKNENVEIRVVLRADQDCFDLYQNPYLEIELPAEVTELEIKSMELLFSNELKIAAYDVIKNDAGNTIIRIRIEGNQTKYATDISGGVNIIINANITLDKKSATSTKQAILRYSNEKAIVLDQNGVATAEFHIEAPSGVVALNTLANFKEQGVQVTSLNNREEVGDLEILTSSKTATMKIDIINNYGVDIKNPVVLGRIPFTGNKKTTGEDLGTTFTAKLLGSLRAENVVGNYTIYYSENGEATEDLSNTNNGWMQEVESYDNIKSYLIVFNDYTMAQGKSASFQYDIQIPEGLNHNESAYGTYTVSYDNTSDGQVRRESVIAPKVGATTGEGPELEVSVAANVENGKDVEEGTIIKYSIHVKNVGNVTAKNIKVKSTIPKGTTYVEYKQEGSYGDNGYIPDSQVKEINRTKDSLEAGQTYTAEYEVRVNQMPNGSLVPDGSAEEDGDQSAGHTVAEKKVEIIMTATITADELEKELATSEYKNNVVVGNFSLELVSNFSQNVELAEGVDILYTGRIKNISSKDQENTVITSTLPEGLTYKEGNLSKDGAITGDGISYDENTRTITFNVGTVKRDQSVNVNILATIGKLSENESEKTFATKISVKSDLMEQAKDSNEVINVTAVPRLTATQTSNKETYINVGEEVEYYVEIKNIGKVIAKNVAIKDILPAELTYVKMKYKIGEEAENENNTPLENNTYTINIPEETTAIVTFVAKVNEIEEEEKQVENKIEITSENANSVNVNSITHIIKKNGQVTTPDGDTVKVYNISGTAWEDSNKNGRKDEEEAKIANMDVILMNARTGEIAKKASNNEEQKVKTGEDGTYTFTEVPEGEYIVIFFYNTDQYILTTYKAQGVQETENSDVISSKVTMNGSTRLAGVTDTIAITDASAFGYNIGIAKASTFKLDIEKVVTKITMQNPKETKTSEFDNSKLAKVDVDGKYINNTNLIIEYKIKVTNSGDIAGYAKKISDVIPSELKFNSELNKDWYVGKDGIAYNTSLGNTVINPGETKEITLVLTKQMDENGNGIVHNTADLAEVYNEYGANHLGQSTDEAKSADVIIGLKLGGGEILAYISLIIATLGVIGLGAYYINKKVLNKI